MTLVDLKTIGYTYKSRSVSNRVWNGVASGSVNLLTEKLCRYHGGAARGHLGRSGASDVRWKDQREAVELWHLTHLNLLYSLQESDMSLGQESLVSGASSAQLWGKSLHFCWNKRVSRENGIWTNGCPDPAGQSPVMMKLLGWVWRTLLPPRPKDELWQSGSQTHPTESATYLISECHYGHLLSPPLEKLCADASA